MKGSELIDPKAARNTQATPIKTQKRKVQPAGRRCNANVLPAVRLH
jgi:hypothetical protein